MSGIRIFEMIIQSPLEPRMVSQEYKYGIPRFNKGTSKSKSNGQIGWLNLDSIIWVPGG